MFDEIIIAIISFYIISAVIFFYPKLIWSPKKHTDPKFKKLLQSNKIMKIAHRGGPRHTTQNTMEGFHKIQNVTDCIEMDVCQTKDNILIVHHDRDLRRTCGVQKMVQQYHYTELPMFLEEIVLDFAVSLTVKTKNEKIPTLKKVFQSFPNMVMNIELKTPTETAKVELVKLIHQHKRQHNTIIGIRNKENKNLQKKHPQLKTFMNDKSVFILAFAYFFGFISFMRITQASLQIPVYSKQFEDWNIGRTPVKDQWKVKLFMRFVKLINFLTKPLIWHLRQRGILSFGWVCNTKEAFDNAVKSGFQGIMTDDPFALQKYLKQKNLDI